MCKLFTPTRVRCPWPDSNLFFFFSYFFEPLVCVSHRLCVRYRVVHSAYFSLMIFSRLIFFLLRAQNPVLVYSRGKKRKYNSGINLSHPLSVWYRRAIFHLTTKVRKELESTPTRIGLAIQRQMAGKIKYKFNDVREYFSHTQTQEWHTLLCVPLSLFLELVFNQIYNFSDKL